MSEKFVYRFGEGKADGEAAMKNLLGGKGANLHEMTRLGIPVPPGFTLSTEVCTYYYAHGQTYPKSLPGDVRASVENLERILGRKFGDADKPLLVSVRSGARASMPGMMDTILNLGLNDRSVEGLARSAEPRFAWDCYRRFIQMYSDVVLEVPKKSFEKALDEAKHRRGTELDTGLTADDLREVVKAYKQIVRDKVGKDFPQDVNDQLWGAIGAVFGSWENERAKIYRRMNKIPDDWGTAVNVQSMVFGNLGETSATGVAFTRDPSTGRNVFFGEWLPNAQGEDVVAGIRTPLPILKDPDRPGKSLEEVMPQAYAELQATQKRLESHYRDMQDLEFTIQDGKLFLLQTRNGKRTGMAAVRIAVDMVDEGILDSNEALKRVEPEQLVQLLAPTFDLAKKKAALAEGALLTKKGLPAGPGAASGRIAFTADRAVEMAAHGPVILARTETSPEDIAGMNAAKGILTSRGGMTSHAAVVARGMGKCCVVGAGDLVIDDDARQLRAGQRVLAEGDFISVDGSTGEVFTGQLPTRPSEIVQVLIEMSLPASKSELFGRFDRLMVWADKVRRMRVRTNADTPRDAQVARAFGAEGIGLCRTEHMFFDETRIRAVREMILADNVDKRRLALAKIQPMQKADFDGIFEAMDGLPVTIRLLDPPLHEFLPHETAAVASVAKDMGVPSAQVEARVEMLKEMNPMLGHRGCRLGITHPEIYEIQVRAIVEAAVDQTAAGRTVLPEIMIPLVGTDKEFEILAEMTHRIAAEVFAAKGRKIDYKVGTMIEVPRAALVADDIAKTAEFFSFGTNDLTQMTYGYSRDDSGTFLQAYIDGKILVGDPFASLDRRGVGALVKMACDKGRATRKDIKLGICGEHGGDPASVEFFHQVGLDYVSCSPYRVAVARLAAARATLGTAEDRTA